MSFTHYSRSPSSAAVHKWIFLSPHFDDVALSCGGLAWELAQQGEAVSVWTICAGEPSPGALSPFAEALHRRWQAGTEVVAQRRQEDRASCAAMGAWPLYSSIPDCIYRRGGAQSIPLYTSERALFGPLHPLETPLVELLVREIQDRLPEGAKIVCPLAVGGHVDHRLVRQAAEMTGRGLEYYADVPYVFKQRPALEGYRWRVYPITLGGLDAWGEAVAAHTSQISSFWPDLESMRLAISEYYGEHRGLVLWEKERGR